MKTANSLSGLPQDAWQAVRIALRNPALSLTIIIGIAVGTGVTCAIFSVVNTVLLRPLNYKNSSELVQVKEFARARGLPLDWVSYPNFSDWREKNSALTGMAAYRYTLLNLTGRAVPELILSAQVSASLFPLLGVSPALGRAFSVEEDRPGGNRVVILSHELWQDTFHANKDVIGISVILNSQPFTIVGVMPPGFTFPPTLPITSALPSRRIGMWVPLGLSTTSTPRGEHSMGVIGRLKRGVGVQQAQADLDRIAAALSRQYPESNHDLGVQVTPLLNEVVGGVRTALILVQIAAGLVLLIMCANISNLLLARLSSRQGEMALRTSLGANRLRLMRQILIENCLLAILGSTLGLVFAAQATPFLAKLNPSAIPRIADVRIDGSVVGFSLLVTIVTVLLSGLMPALSASRVDLRRILAAEPGRTTSGKGALRMQEILVAAEVALGTALLIGSGLVIKTFRNVEHVDPGLRPDGILTAWLLLPETRYPKPAQWTLFYEQALDKLKALPGVTLAGAINDLPLTGLRGSRTFDTFGKPLPAGAPKPAAEVRIVGGNYFSTMQVPLVSGRGFLPQDGKSSECVVIANEKAARRYWSNENPIGARISFGENDSHHAAWSRIVGIAKDVRDDSLEWDARPEFYIPLTQYQCGISSAFMVLILRTSSNPSLLSGPVRRQIAALDSEQSVFTISTMAEIYSDALAGKRFNVFVLSLFGLCALILAGLGVYGVTAHSVMRRTQEVGIRMALGAEPAGLIKAFLIHGMLAVAAGIAFGVMGALSVSRFLESMLYGLTSVDPLTYFEVSATVALVALIAIYIPARRAARTNLLISLKSY